jgi:hypothetical protein
MEKAIPFQLDSQDRVVMQNALQQAQDVIQQRSEFAAQLDMQTASSQRIRKETRNQAEAFLNQAEQLEREANRLRKETSSGFISPEKAAFNLRQIQELDSNVRQLIGRARQVAATAEPRVRENQILKQQSEQIKARNAEFKAGLPQMIRDQVIASREERQAQYRRMKIRDDINRQKLLAAQVEASVAGLAGKSESIPLDRAAIELERINRIIGNAQDNLILLEEDSPEAMETQNLIQRLTQVRSILADVALTAAQVTVGQNAAVAKPRQGGQPPQQTQQARSPQQTLQTTPAEVRQSIKILKQEGFKEEQIREVLRKQGISQ